MAKIEIPKPKTKFVEFLLKKLAFTQLWYYTRTKKNIILFGDLYEIILCYVKALGSCNFSGKTA